MKLQNRNNNGQKNETTHRGREKKKTIKTNQPNTTNINENVFVYGKKSHRIKVSADTVLHSHPLRGNALKEKLSAIDLFISNKCISIITLLYSVLCKSRRPYVWHVQHGTANKKSSN